MLSARRMIAAGPITVFAIWMTLALSGFWMAFIAPAQAQRNDAVAALAAAAPQLRQWRLQHAAETARGTLVQLPALRCPCAAAPTLDTQTLRVLTARAGVAFEQASATAALPNAALVPGQDLLLFAADGEIVAAGSTQGGPLCGSPRAAVALLISTLAGHRNGAMPIGLGLRCQCGGDDSRLYEGSKT
ncbi:hypothetical protein G7Y82_15180 [Solimonas sp. C16B3]|uniref:DUF6436 domain-containing protein n=1 Tax=Solimonas marina TaxID=2714601 RepID=A0A969WCG5_9GAMM|nr:hypothetical protein [Solimonas marina]